MRSTTIVSLVAVALLMVSLLGGYQELSAFRVRADTAAGSPPERHTVLPVPGLSGRLARRARLEACNIHLNALLDAGAAAAGREVVRQCLALAESIAARAPLSANEWFIASEFANDAGDAERMANYLRRSFDTAPTEQWISGRRSMFTYALGRALAPEFQSLVDHDLLVMLQTESGIRALAKYYVSDPSLRQRIVDLAVTLDPERQLRLLTLGKKEVAPATN